MPTVVLDTNVVVRWLLPAQADPAAQALVQWCAANDVQIALPSQVTSEALATVRRSVIRNELSAEEGTTKVAELVDFSRLCQMFTTVWEAFDVATRFGRPNTYDSEVYALAARLGAELWTADDRFVNSMGSARPAWVHRLSDFSPTT